MCQCPDSYLGPNCEIGKKIFILFISRVCLAKEIILFNNNNISSGYTGSEIFFSLNIKNYSIINTK
jgi:hypothetical protein